MNYLSIIILIAVCGLSSALADWKLSKSQVLQQSPTNSYQYVRKSVAHGSLKATLHLYFFDSRRCELRIIDQGEDSLKPKYKNLGEAMKTNQCLAGCNGGFFTPEFQPVGLMIADGDRIGHWQNSKLLGGALYLKDQESHLVWRDEFHKDLEVDHLIQAGPRLISDAKAIEGLSDSDARPRTFVLTDGKHQWAIGACYSTTLKELGSLLATPGIISEMSIQRGLNLDGGSSTGFWVRGNPGKSPFYQREWVTVRNYVGIVARENPTRD